jgi:hypothetical protein
MFLRTFLATLSVLSLVGCGGGTTISALPADHPGNSAAAEAPLPPRSQTLAIDDPRIPESATNPADLKPDMGDTRHDMKRMQHGHDTKGMKHDVPATRPGENAAPSAPRWTPTTLPTTHPATAASYTCKMHPQVVSNHPGKCPKCRMKLVPRQTGQEPNSQDQGGHR